MSQRKPAILLILIVALAVAGCAGPRIEAARSAVSTLDVVRESGMAEARRLVDAGVIDPTVFDERIAPAALVFETALDAVAVVLEAGGDVADAESWITRVVTLAQATDRLLDVLSPYWSPDSEIVDRARVLLRMLAPAVGGVG